MPPGTLTKQARKLDHKIGEQHAYAADLLNDDFDQIDVLTDEYAELQQQLGELQSQVTACETAEERGPIREQMRDLRRQIRALDTRMLDRYIESSDGEHFGEPVLAQVPVRVQTALIRQASKIIYGEEDPTTAASASG